MDVVSAGHPKHLQNKARPHHIWGWLYASHSLDCANPPETNQPSWDLSLTLSPCASQQWLTMERMTKAGKKPMIT